MGRTIAMKLTHQEEGIIDQLHKQGKSNSEILREALWHYLEDIKCPVGNQEVHSTRVNQQSLEGNLQVNQMVQEEDVNPIIQDYILHLKEEIKELREQNLRLQEQIDREMTRLHGQIYRFSTLEQTRQLPMPKIIDQTPDIHKDIDNLILKKNTFQRR
ncbi:MAG: hypothetical protein QXL17_01480 [Candidatus Thermoplasmatota archaeon]